MNIEAISQKKEYSGNIGSNSQQILDYIFSKCFRNNCLLPEIYRGLFCIYRGMHIASTKYIENYLY